MILLPLIVGIASAAALAMSAISLGIPYWRDTTVDQPNVQRTITTHTYSGLWAACTTEVVKVENIIQCESYFTSKDNPNYTAGLRTVQATSILGTGGAGALLVMLVIKSCLLPDSKVISKVMGVVAILAGFFLLLSVVIYATSVKDGQSFSVKDLSAGFGMSVVAGIVLVLVGILCCFMK
ncbi:uncharacterized protein LOC127837810 [Dreissena polymorpha]|uniref:Claudin n=1 Tax=Dreissena polymorpha TaxID=45954 RepID=A0A9D4F5X0_DREPO|nr:uncharacterized protein LOC127837810 [Dreissena polymorpha]KAH3792925.1 hypothetical protein DPMN_146426 [Dreissena polymorpha]